MDFLGICTVINYIALYFSGHDQKDQDQAAFDLLPGYKKVIANTLDRTHNNQITK